MKVKLVLPNQLLQCDNIPLICAASMREKEALKYLSWLCISGCTPFTKQMDKSIGSLLCMQGGAIGGSIVFARHFVLRGRDLKIDSIHQYNPPVLPFLCVSCGRRVTWYKHHLLSSCFRTRYPFEAFFISGDWNGGYSHFWRLAFETNIKINIVYSKEILASL